MLLKERGARIPVPKLVLELLQSLILADGDELHLGRDDSLAGIPKLTDGVAFARAQGTATLAGQAGKFDQAILLCLAGIFRMHSGEVTVVLRFHIAAIVFFDVSPGRDPVAAQRQRRPASTFP